MSNNMMDLDWVWSHCSYDNWDGFDGCAVTPECFAIVREIHARFPDLYKIATISPLSNGTFSFEWEADNDHWFNLEIGKERYSAFRHHEDESLIEYFPAATETGPNADVLELIETQVTKFVRDFNLDGKDEDAADNL